MELWHLVLGIVIALCLHDEKNLRQTKRNHKKF